MPEGTTEKVEFVTINSEEMTFGKNNFLEIAHKKAVSEKGENEFISISRGFTNPAGMKRFKSSVSMPVDMAERVAKALTEVRKKTPQ